ncbi:similar to An01g00420 [Aspergillus niger]|uniref:Similar to An01g00420 n=1 Tax=Aspergillus niger TaxID=5061 RepID=A0A100IU06_ASPNG|nr:similar to An01g00420 [Aspergillus niger]
MERTASPVSTFIGLATRADPSPLPPPQEIFVHIQEMYDSGKPFYTKELLRNLKQQIQDARDGIIQSIRVPGLDGVFVEFPVLIGQVYPAHDEPVYPEFQDRSAFQHALLLTLRDIFCKMHNVSQDAIPCFAQDPVCKKNDIVAAGEYGIKIVEDPDAFLEVDESTVVVSVAPNIAVRQIVFDIARPAVLISNKVRDQNEDHM